MRRAYRQWEQYARSRDGLTRLTLAHYTIVAMLASGAIVYLYADAKRALAKVKTLQRQAKRFKITDDNTDVEITASDLEARAVRKA